MEKPAHRVKVRRFFHKALYDYIVGDMTYIEFQNIFYQSFSLITKDPMTGADVRKVFIMLQLLLEKYWEVLVDWDMSQTVKDIT